MNAMSNNMWAGMSMIEEIDRGTLNRFLAAPASRIGIMNASVAEQAVSTTVQSLIIVGLGLAGGARYHGGGARGGRPGPGPVPVGRGVRPPSQPGRPNPA